MRIRLKCDLPIEVKHGAMKGRVFKVAKRDGSGYWFDGDAGELCKAWRREVEVLPDEKGNPCASRL